jgi:hypothetical protein
MPNHTEIELREVAVQMRLADVVEDPVSRVVKCGPHPYKREAPFVWRAKVAREGPYREFVL